MSDSERSFDAGSITIWGVRCDIRVVVDPDERSGISVEGPDDVIDNLDFQVQHRVLGIDGTQREPTSGNEQLRVTVPPGTDMIASIMSGKLLLDTRMIVGVRGTDPVHLDNDA
tara:strand:+ start:363 stop:701 length:339 start_codon:yes stop_codon:yes gene_type:complete